LATGIQAAAAQEGAGGTGDVADRLWGIEERLEAINQSNSQVLWASLAIAIVAAVAATYYGVQLRKQLNLSEDDAKHRLRAVLTWHMLDDGSPIGVYGAGGRPGGLTIRVVNTGQVSAVDIVAYLDARIVGSGGRCCITRHE